MMTEQQISVLEVLLKMLKDVHDFRERDKEYQETITRNWGNGHPRDVAIAGVRDAIARRGFFAERPEA